MERLRVGILGATGMVGQRFVTLLADHPWFRVVSLAASPRSAGRPYSEAVKGRWTLLEAVPDALSDVIVKDVNEISTICDEVDFVCAAVDMPKASILELEEAYARRETPVISNNSAHRWTPDVPILMPEINPEHIDVIPAQRKRLGMRNGFICVKPNCSIQPYVPALHALSDFGPAKAVICTYQALSGAGKTFRTWPEMVDNVIPFIAGEEEKSVREPLKIWGRVAKGRIVATNRPLISAQCVRVPVSDGHMAAVSVAFETRPAIEQIRERWDAFQGSPRAANLPSSAHPFLCYSDRDDRPQTRIDRDAGGGMGVTLGRLREDSVLDFKFVALSHNTVRGAAGGGILMAELLKAEGFLNPK